jgi:hypothetical protein
VTTSPPLAGVVSNLLSRRGFLVREGSLSHTRDHDDVDVSYRPGDVVSELGGGFSNLLSLSLGTTSSAGIIRHTTTFLRSWLPCCSLISLFPHISLGYREHWRRRAWCSYT